MANRRTSRAWGAARKLSGKLSAPRPDPDPPQRGRALGRGLLDCFPCHVAVLDGKGAILQVNAAWEAFAKTNGLDWEFGGISYLKVCDGACGSCSEEAPCAAAGIRSVITGRKKQFLLEYPCHSPTEQRWFNMRVRPVIGPRGARAVVAHEDVTRSVSAERDAADARRRLATAQDDERKRLARELHDSIGQKLFSLELMLKGLGNARRKKTTFAKSLASARRSVRDLICEVRNLSHMLYPAGLEETGLVPLLRQLLADCQRPDMTIALRCSRSLEKDRFPPEVEAALFRITQEAVCNALRHSKARRVGVLLRYQEGKAVLSVTDDGIGFDPSKPREGLGLRTMMDRTKALSGEFRIESQPGCTRVEVAIPTRLRKK